MNFLDIKGKYLHQGKIPFAVYDNADIAFCAMSEQMTDCIRANNLIGKKTLFIVPVGPVGQYKYFVNTVNSENLSLQNVTFINMDEYMADSKQLIDINDSLSFRKFMNESCYGLIKSELLMPEEQRIFPTPINADIIDDTIDRHGGVDICFGGIGINGHIAFNEPTEKEDNISDEEFCSLGVRVTKISRETKVANGMNEFKGAYYMVPDYCVTLGFKQILKSKRISLFCFRPWHYSVVRRAAFGNKSADFPVTLLQGRDGVSIGISKELEV